jgi:hypothetical protein
MIYIQMFLKKSLFHFFCNKKLIIFLFVFLNLLQLLDFMTKHTTHYLYIFKINFYIIIYIIKAPT